MTDSVDAKEALLTEILQRNVGLSQYEANVYMALVRGGKQTMTELAESSGVPKQRVYDIVENLQQEGFAEVVDDYPQKAYAVDPTEALSPIQRQLEQAETYLDELHETVDATETGVTLFKSRPTIQKHLRRLIEEAENDLFLLAPRAVVDDLRETLRSRAEGVHVRLIVSGVPLDDVVDDELSLDSSFDDVADDVRGVVSREPLILTADRQSSIYWPTPTDTATGGQQGFYVSNPDLALVLDRFLADMIWSLAKPAVGDSGAETLSLPAHYVRIRDCLSDIKRAAKTRPVDSFEVEFSGYDTRTDEAVTKRGTLVGYYFTEYDLRAFLRVELHEDDGPRTVSVGGWRSRNEDFEARSLVIRENADAARPSVDEATGRHLATCREELAEGFSDAHAVAGFDAFIDRMREFVADRTSEGAYTPVEHFSTFVEDVVEFEASERTPRLEWNQTATEPGGHTAHVGRVFDAVGYDVSLVGRFGDPIRSVFADRFGASNLLSVGEATATDYVVFDDRRLLLTEPNFTPLDWETITERVEVETLAEHVDDSAVLSIGSWSSTPALPTIWEGLRTDLWPLLESPPKAVQFSPADIEWLSDEVLQGGVESLSQFDDEVPVTVTLTRNQSQRLLDALGRRTTDGSLADRARNTRQALGVSTCIVHTHTEAVLADGEDVVSVRAPGSHNGSQNVEEYFDFGVALALAEGLSAGASLVLGHAVAGYVASEGRPPNASELYAFLDEYETG